MKKLIVMVSMAALLFIVVWTFCYTTGHITQKGYTLGLLLGSIGWFASAPFWIKSE